MLTKIITIILNYLVTYLIIPVSMVVVDYFKMKKTIKLKDLKIAELEKALTVQEKIDAVNNLP